MNNSKSSQNKKIPKIILIGNGRFGKNHFRVLKELDTKGLIVLDGIVVRNKEDREKIEKEFGVKTYEKITPSLLKSVDAVDIVTPPETHFELIKKCLPYVNVFVEKPIATNEKDAEKLELLAKKYNRVLAVGHIFRHHPVTKKLKSIIGKKGMPKKIKGSFINPLSLDQGREPSLEFLHMFDVVDSLWEIIPKTISGKKDDRLTLVDVRYNDNNDAHFTLGCHGDKKIRELEFSYEDYTIKADFVSNIITHKKGETTKKYICDPKIDLLHEELHHFVLNLLGKKEIVANATTGKRIVSIAEKSVPKKLDMPSVAIIGGGIFGTSAALELAKFCSVTIFEKNSDLMQEGTYANCFRHHRGYHYPRSSETVIDIQNSNEDFEKVYKGAIVTTYPTYYGISKKDSHISAKDFMVFCRKHNLVYDKELLPASILSKKEISLCVRVPEPGYNYEKLTNIVKKRIEKESTIKVSNESLITNISLEKDGTKTITYTKNNRTLNKKGFDYVINATYANINRVIDWLSFEQRPIRVDLAEVLIVKLNIPPVSITIIDGPFTTLVPTGNKNEFTLYHVTESILDRYVPKNGLIKKDWKRLSNQESIIKESQKFLPILKDAVVTESRIVHRGVEAYREHDDSRVVDLVEHGFGCFSILSGKILSSVTTGKKIANIIKKNK